LKPYTVSKKYKSNLKPLTLFFQSGLGALANSGASPLLIPYDGSVNPINYIQRSAAGQTAFYQTLSNQVIVDLRGVPNTGKRTDIRILNRLC
jgi:hypothetical protein